MTIDWEAGKNTKALRKAILTIYPDRIELAIFLEDELEENLDAIAHEGNLTKDVFKLIQWAKAKSRIDELYQKFCECNAENSKITALQREIEGESLAPSQPTKISEADWQQLHSIFTSHNLPEVSRAFLNAFEACLGRSFRRVYPDRNPFDFDQIYKTLEDLDEPRLAATFSDRALSRLTAENNGTKEQLRQLTQWRDRLLAAHRLALTDIQPDDTRPKQGYLLVSLAEQGKRNQKKGVYVNVFAELHVTGQPTPVPFGGTSTTCPLDEVAEHLGGLIKKAEQAIENRLTLELFLPCAYLEHDVASWVLKHEGEEFGILGSHQAYLIRSLKRARNNASKTCIEAKWQQLMGCVEGGDPCQQFHTQDACPEWGDLAGNLNMATGLFLTAELPAGEHQRQRIISDIVNAAVPIALWFSAVEEGCAEERQQAFDALLEAGCVTHFAALAQHWQQHRVNNKTSPGRHLKLLCDCPHRWPNLPDANSMEDALISAM